ncbi:EAL domain-containing protein [Malikia spinosa]|uniref:EAL domain-containing protein n=1 Tax=Malikia spinosa TaxID=86180 RepID=UPI0027B934E4|nr:EAL domain-containing protein [Malikia spinosa]
MAAVPASVRIGLIYLVLASVWIWGSDWLALQLLGDPAAVTQAQSLKGELFVLFTAALLFWLIGREERVQARVQDELKRTRSQLEHFIDTSASIIYALVPDTAAADGWRLSYVSGNVLRLTGYAPADWLERTGFWFEHVHPDDRPRVQQAQRQLHDTGELRQRYRFQHRDGSYRWIDDQQQLCCGADGQPLEIVGSWGDVTEQEQTQQALRDRQVKLDAFLTHAPAALAMFNREMRYLFASQRWIRDFQLGAVSDLIGRSHYELCPDMPPHWKEAHQRAFAGETVRREEEFYRLPDGSERWLRWRVKPCESVNGRVESIIILAEDITQHKRDQEQLRAEKRRWRFAVDGSDIGLWDWNVSASTVFFSSCWKTMLGYSEHEIGDQLCEWESRVHPDDKAQVMADVGRHLSGEVDFYANEHRVLCKDGSYKWILDRGRVVERGPDGQPLRMIGTHTDLTALKLREQALALNASLFMNSSEGIVICDGDNCILSVNRAFSDITGYSADEVLGRQPSLLRSGQQTPDFYRDMWRQILEAGRWQGEILNRRKDGESFLAWLTISLVRDQDGQVRNYYGIFHDITQRKQAEARISQLTHYDALTGLPNRALLRDRIESQLAQARPGQGALALMFIDVDRFKYINDSLGHRAGDALLVEMASRLEQAVRPQDTVSRMGGDEFTLLLPQIDAEGTAHLAQKIIARISAPCQFEGMELIVTPSIGIAMFPGDGREVDALLQAGDTAMYRAKAAGGANFQFYEPGMHLSASRTLQLENALRRALGRHELALHYQPQIELKTRRVTGCEALLRWTHPQLGMIPPSEFMPIAEASGLILPIGEWVLRTAVAQNQAWQQAGLAPTLMAVNVSSVQFRQTQFPELVRAVLDEAGLPPGWLELELTESVVSADPEAAIRIMEQLDLLGVQLSVDDFGTGYSSLSYLKRFPIDKLKIDQSFVRDLDSDPGSALIVSGVIAMARALGLKTIAEGVETAEQAATLAREGSDEVQGYWYARPMPAEQYERWLRDYLSAAYAPGMVLTED